MEISEDINTQLEQFKGLTVAVHQYTRFGRILRLSIYDQEGEDWILSFSDCQRATFPTSWKINGFRFISQEDGLICCQDTDAGFSVQFKQCYLINGDDYLADDPNG